MDNRLPEEKKEDVKPEPIELHVTFAPTGELKINCPLMHNPLLMRGFIDMVHDAIKQILETNARANEPSKIVKPGGILNFARNKRF